jgi:hypothetical protein
VIVHNPKIREFNNLVQIKLPNSNFSAKIYNKENGQFEIVEFDILR